MPTLNDEDKEELKEKKIKYTKIQELWSSFDVGPS